jgi:hypothetical protein
MSAKISQTATAIVITDKFIKELEKFFEWVIESEYLIKDINSDQHEWSIKLLTKFEEPGRNKLEAYIKALFAKYTISLNEMDIEDAKLLAKEFKDKGGKTSKKSQAVDAEEKPKKSKVEIKEVVEKVEEFESEKEKTIKKSKVEVKEVESENESENVKLDMSLDTSETFNVDTLEFWTSELVEVFGKPKKTGGKDDEHTWEWKIEVNGDPFTIYDWNENGDNFEDTTWYLGATSENKKNIKTLISYIESWFEGEVESEAEAEKPKKKVTTTEVEKPKKKVTTTEVEKPKKVKEVIEVEEKVDMDELFGDDSDSDIELDLDNIEQDE